MNTTSHAKKISFIALFAILSFAAGVLPPTSGSSHPPDRDELSVNSHGTNSLGPEPLAGSGEYYLLRRDVRRCASPLCGGYFVKRVNQSRTRCANGRWMRECYVGEIEWKGQREIDPGHAVVRRDVVACRFHRLGNRDSWP